MAHLPRAISIDLQEAYDIINQTNLVIFKWTLSEAIPTDFVSENISIFGYEPEDFYTGALKDYWAFVYEADREKTKKMLYDVREQNLNHFKNQYRVVCRNGEIRWVEEWVIHERDATGKLIHEKGIIRDINDSVRISEKLKESEAKYKELFDNASAIIFTFNRKGEITNYNKTFIETLKISNSFENCVIEDFLALYYRTHSLFSQCVEKIGTRFELEITDLKGHKKFIELNYRLVYQDGEPFEIHAVGQDITERKLATEKINFLTSHDTLTGLYNRAYFDQTIIAYRDDEDKNVSIIIGDVNGLKMVNDAFGHKLGDELLIQVAAILKSVFYDPKDVIARLSGDEFAIITERKNVGTLMDRIHAKCNAVVNFPFKIDISLGFSSRKKSNIGIEGIFREADHQMYKNKLKTSKHIKSMLIQTLQQKLSEESLETVEHAERIKILSEKVGAHLNLSETVMEELDLTAIMHDIGMISIPKEILNKRGKLNQKEMKEVMKHAEIGYHLLVATPNLAGIGDYVLAHHENYDGTGYPQGLSGGDIPLISRIITVVDSYEAMTHVRSYREAKTSEQAIDEILSLSGTRYDPNIVHAFLKVMENWTGFYV
ncbi:HD domain-containing phosphohydrolase [Fusibacter sp. 3D3]|uniref:HD domain-containing phosphohydrolase n=1 Tax=Fusibacter sp. 3D3 TaxID=1048380 RepID=UPI000853EDE6|nr:HD domain-containing phosphohydrolase [Fusibacter sp. 3D3]GAU77665.1 diguanylate cyclase/phosphodiesterase [Fusibacter sp. 3D3]